MSKLPLLDVQNLKISFSYQGQERCVVRSISFQIAAGKIMAIVGQSGSGKSVTALSFTRLLPSPPSCKITGKISYCGKVIGNMSNSQLRAIRGKEIAYIFQEPATSLNPVFTIGQQITEAIRLHTKGVGNLKQRVIGMLNKVGIRDAVKRYDAYPHELSGGMQQRAMIAMALVCQPKILVADEPTTALDATIEKQIIELLKEIRRNSNMSILLITHNFGIVAGFADEVIVMFRGKIVERGLSMTILQNPKHPYTKALIACIPQLGQNKYRLPTIDYSAIPND